MQLTFSHLCWVMVTSRNRTNKGNMRLGTWNTVKPVFNDHSKRAPKVVFNTDYRLNVCQKYCRMLEGELSAMRSTFIKLPYSIKTFVLSVFKRPLKIVARDCMLAGYTCSYREIEVTGREVILYSHADVSGLNFRLNLPRAANVESAHLRKKCAG